MAKRNLSFLHDSFFKSWFSDRTEALAFLRDTLEFEMVAALDLESLELVPQSYVDEDLKQYFADLVFTCALVPEAGESETGTVKITLLFEHKSVPPEYPHLQILRYMLNIWESHVKEKGTNGLRLVLPILIYHGEESWRERSFESYFAGGKVPVIFREFLPSFNFRVINLRELSDEEIRNSYHLLSLRTALLTMKYIRESNIFEFLPLIFSDLGKMMGEPSGGKKFEQILVYLIKYHKLPRRKLMEKLAEITPDGARVGSLYWELKEEGKKEGKIEGMIEGKIEGKKEGKIEGMLEARKQVAINMFNKGLSIEQIAMLTEFSISELKKIQAELEA